MTIRNALASLAVRNLDAAEPWYRQLFGRPGHRAMQEVAEWKFDGGGGLQVYQLPERAGTCSCTLAVENLDSEAARLVSLGINARCRTEDERVRTLMIADPDGNSIALAEPIDPTLLR